MYKTYEREDGERERCFGNTDHWRTKRNQNETKNDARRQIENS